MATTVWNDRVKIFTRELKRGEMLTLSTEIGKIAEHTEDYVDQNADDVVLGLIMERCTYRVDVRVGDEWVRVGDEAVEVAIEDDEEAGTFALGVIPTPETLSELPMSLYRAWQEGARDANPILASFLFTAPAVPPNSVNTSEQKSESEP